MPRFPLEDWFPESLRLTVFPRSNPTFNPEWWEGVTGAEPDELSSAKRGTSSALGPYKTGKLLLRSGLDRIDWVFAPADSTVEKLLVSTNWDTIGPIQDVMEAFVMAMGKWFDLDDTPETNRIAFGAIMGHAVEDKEDAYRDLMQSYIPVKVDPSSSDLLFQINPPHSASKHVTGLEFNRLSKWMVAQRMVVAEMAGGVTMGVPLQQATTSGLSIRLELDINTLPTFTGLIPRALRFEVFKELVEEGKSIIRDGVIPHEQAP